MARGIKVEVEGNYAQFCRPEFKAERLSYDVMTASAAIGILEAVYWHPGLRYVIDKIYVLNPIKFANIRRNEVKSKALASKTKALKVMNGDESAMYIATSEDNNHTQRAATVLKDVHYIIEAHFEMTEQASQTDTEEKFYAIMMRRLRNGQCFHQPYFGVREFPAVFSLHEGKLPKTAYTGEMDLGFMLYNMDYTDTKDIKPMFRRIVMQDGIIDFTNQEVKL